MSLRVAAAQLRSTDDPRQNALTVDRMAAQAADAGAQLLVCPEATMVDFTTKLRPHAEPLDGPFVESLRTTARERGLWLVAGMFEPAEDGERVYNTAVATDGDRLVSYRKQHLYDAFGGEESRTVAPGDELVTFDALGTTIGLATCYDLRFAEQFADLRRAGARLVCVPASWARGRGKLEQWDLLVRSRAMDAQAFLVAADQPGEPGSGSDDDEDTRPLGVGHSAVIGPFGRVVERLGHEAGLLVTDVDPDESDRARELIPLD